jgi:ABC-type phosphate/phosphonate transport system substrate-binding protein
MGYPWCLRTKLDQGLQERLTRAFLDLGDAELLKVMRAERYTRVTRSDYDEIRSEAKRLGLLK